MLPSKTTFDNLAHLKIGMARFDDLAHSRTRNNVTQRQRRHRAATQGHFVDKNPQHRIDRNKAIANQEAAIGNVWDSTILNRKIRWFQVSLRVALENHFLRGLIVKRHGLNPIWFQESKTPGNPCRGPARRLKDYRLNKALALPPQIMALSASGTPSNNSSILAIECGNVVSECG